MKNTNSKIVKVILIIVLSIALAIGAYIYLPNISNALNSAVNNLADEVGKITALENVFLPDVYTYEHRGYAIYAHYSEKETVTYENAAGNTGITDIQSIIDAYLSPMTALELDEGGENHPAYGWINTLRFNTSIFCIEADETFPSLYDRIWGGCHNGGDSQGLAGTEPADYIEWEESLCCSGSKNIRTGSWKGGGVESQTTSWSEAAFWADIGAGVGNGTLQNVEQFTVVNLQYKATPKTFNVAESYIYSYSKRNYFLYNPAQLAIWLYLGQNGGSSDEAVRLYNAAKAVEELSNPVAPKMSATTDNTTIKSTGTVIDGTSYKVGPIYMNQYTYGYSDNVKEFSGAASLNAAGNADLVSRMDENEKEFFKGLIAGIVEAKVELDSGKVIYLDGNDFIYSEQNNTVTGGTYYTCPTAANGYEYPTPNSKFYFKLPISECEGATKITKVTMTYKWTTATGNGGVLEGKYDILKFETGGQAISENKGCIYKCGNPEGDGMTCKHDVPHDQRSANMASVNEKPHDFWCDTTGYCNSCSKNGPTACIGHQGGYKCNQHHAHTDECYPLVQTCNGSHCTHTEEERGTLDHEMTCGGHIYSESSCKTKSTTASSCPYGDKHDEKPWNSAADPGCFNTNYTNDYCKHGFAGGKHTCGKTGEHDCIDWGESHLGLCKGPEGVGTKCSHNHRNCLVFSWKCTIHQTGVDSQKCEYVTKTDVIDKFEECTLTEIPLVTKVEVNKYIYDVKHNTKSDTPGGIDTTYKASNERRALDEETKEANPVYVEVKDLVIFKIVFTNDSAFDVYIRADDVLPDASAYTFKEAYIGETRVTSMPDLRASRIRVDAYSESTISVTLQVEAIEGKYENLAKIITRNGPNKDPNSDDVDYIRTVDDNGPIVNHIDEICQGTTEEPRWEASDFFMLNNYNLHIDKYVHEYDELVLKDNNSNSFTDEASVTEPNSNVLAVTRQNTSKTTVKVSDGNVEDIVRQDDGAQEKYKEDHPVNAEKTETLTYAIKVSNEAKTINKNVPSGSKPATQIIPVEITDKLHRGLSYQSIHATIYNEDGSVKRDILDDTVVCDEIGEEGDLNVYKITTNTSVILNPGEYIIYYIEARIIQSNMYLYDMPNTAELVKVANINIVTKAYNPRTGQTEDLLTRNISKQQITTEHVRMKDLVISGQVWLDIDRDGLMNDKPRSELEEINNDINGNAMKKDVIVRLYRVDGSEKGLLVRTTKTDENGLYSFGRDDVLTWYDTFNHTMQYDKDKLYQRIDKASDKDANGNYTANSTYYSYYIEFVYDGVVYKSTEFYAGMDNLTGNDGRYNTLYPIDSNATEIITEREEFNKQYEYISYDVAYDLDLDKSGDLVFEKERHESLLIEDSARAMTSKSFVVSHDTNTIITAIKRAMNSCGANKWKNCSNHWKHWQLLISMNIIDESKYPNTKAGRLAAQAELKSIYETVVANANATGGTQMMKYLWLYSYNGDVDFTIPETEYLKYINLGLELREDVDLALTKDIYQIKTTINGEEMTYSYNKNNGLNGEIVESDDNKYLKNYIVKQPYGFEIYESDYKYRVEQFTANAVKEYKGLQGEDELNVEVTFRMTIDNHAVTDDDDIANDPDRDADKPPVTDTKLDVRVHEVLDLYDEDFMELQFNNDGTMKVGAVPDTDTEGQTNSGNYNEVAVKVKDEKGYLETKNLVIGEAWYFKKAADVTADDKVVGGKYSILNNEDVDGDGDVDDDDLALKLADSKPIYIEDPDGEYAKVELTILGQSSRGKGKFSEKNNDFTADGYNTLYITGMGNEVIHEGDCLDIYVKYVLDKEELDITVTNETTFEETKTDANTTTSTDGTVTTNSTIITMTGTNTATLDRSLKLAENIATEFKEKYGRGTEGIAQIDAYSVWYTDGKPASLVDKDSNAGNLGVKNISEMTSPKTDDYEETMTSADDIDYYEDITYKTGVHIVADGTENSKEKFKDEDWFIDAFGELSLDLYRDIDGVVWDDSRSTTLGTGNETQYVGNGRNSEDDRKLPEAKDNENVELNYKDASVTEEEDIAVRNARAEFIEIVNIPIYDASGTLVENRYYEEVLSDVTWDQVQHIRTNDNGEYTLKGLKPGTYIVRFTYGDTIEENVEAGLYNPNLQAQQDMLIFNGQDYKSTQYNELLADTEIDIDEVLRILEVETYSDARDDEIRRLEANSYSEVMTNQIAEILKGVANGTKLTPNSYANNENELRALTDNTYMMAETREFLVKAEKLTAEQTLEQQNLKDQVLEGESYEEAVERLSAFIYNNIFEIRNRFLTERDFTINNVDFGIEYRPESEISLLKEISEIKLTTASNETLVDLCFYTVENTNGTISHHIDEDKSKGFELVQFISNDYVSKALLNSLTKEESIQGLVYVQIDKEILQGATVEITYAFDAQNNGEVDRISKNLDAIRYKDNPATQALAAADKYGAGIYDKDNYTASSTGRNIVYADTYRTDAAQPDVEYRIMPKTTTTSGTNGYFGRYVGYGYFTGDESNLDTISSLKFDKILDYVDNGLDFEGDITQTNTANKSWKKVTAEQAVGYVYQLKAYTPTRLVTPVGVPIENAPTAAPILTDLDGYEYELVMSVDTSTKNSDEENFTIDAEGNKVYTTGKNTELSRFLLPKVSVVGPEADTTILTGIDEDTRRKYSGTISLELSKVLDPDTLNSDMSYENIAEIVQFTTLTGRRTNFATTIGNADIHDVEDKLNRIPTDPSNPTPEINANKNSGSIEFITASLEPDTSATETVTLIPPTGVMLNRRALVNVMDAATTSVEIMSMTGLVVAIIAVVVIAILFVIRKYKKRRIV